MPFLKTQAQAWDSAFWEFSLVFEDFDDDDLWRRADPKLLSVGEIVAHIVYSLVSYAKQIDPNSNIESLLANDLARYYLTTVDQPVVLPLGVKEIEQELDRVQKAVKAVFLGSAKEREDPLDFQGPGQTYGQFADYMVFHAAYHTGQAFSVRHLMGHKTNNN